MSKPVLYTFSGSAWAAVPELAVAELYPDGAIDTKVVNLVRGENFNPSFIKLNSNATLPTLEVDGKVYTSTKDVTAYLVENAPRLVKRGTSLTDIVHEDKLDPNFALILSRNDEELKVKSAEFVSTYLSGRQDALNTFSATTEATSFKAFYEAKMAANDSLLGIFTGEAPDTVKEAFFKRSQAHYDTIAAFVNQDLPGYLPTSGFIGGEEPGEDDFHLGAWLARIVLTLGAQTSEEAVQAVERLPEKVAVYWRLWASRASWKKVYAKGLGNMPSPSYR